jgi:hypothetical protein
MRPLAQVKCIAAVLCFGSAVAACQSTLPPTAPTMRDIDEQPANVQYADGQIAVLAENSSLSEIIRDVARRAGMAVKGSVVDERVFGTYGPAAPADVLTQLLKGTGSNMVVLAGVSHVPELILTPRQGGPTPPRTIAEIVDSEADADRGPEAEEDAHAAKKNSGAEQPVQASTDSDKAGLTQEKPKAEASDGQPDTKSDADADPNSSTQPAGQALAQ